MKKSRVDILLIGGLWLWVLLNKLLILIINFNKTEIWLTSPGDNSHFHFWAGHHQTSHSSSFFNTLLYLNIILYA